MALAAAAEMATLPHPHPTSTPAPAHPNQPHPNQTLPHPFPTLPHPFTTQPHPTPCHIPLPRTCNRRESSPIQSATLQPAAGLTVRCKLSSSNFALRSLCTQATRSCHQFRRCSMAGRARKIPHCRLGCSPCFQSVCLVAILLSVQQGSQYCEALDRRGSDERKRSDGPAVRVVSHEFNIQQQGIQGHAHSKRTYRCAAAIAPACYDASSSDRCMCSRCAIYICLR